MTGGTSLRTEAEVAGILGISEHSLKRLRLAGQGPPCARIGRFPRYHLGLLEEWIIAKSKRENQQYEGNLRASTSSAGAGGTGFRCTASRA